jgi:peptidoglycan hydrolase-like protein with peptidoglycan-binding domain
MKISAWAALMVATSLTLTQPVGANPPGRGGGSLGAIPHFSSPAHFARPASAGPVRRITAPRPAINIPRSQIQPATRYIHPPVTVGTHLPPRSWANNPATARSAPTTTAQSRAASTTPAARNAQNNNNRLSFAEAAHRHNREWHDSIWWRNHYSNIVLVGAGYYFWDSGYWYPAWGYDPSYNSYPYDGPIYGFDGLNPDQVVADVQTELQREGYYTGAVNGILDPLTQAAISYYQRDHNLAITSVVDAATVTSLGLG